jgi:hypothetical protein
MIEYEVIKNNRIWFFKEDQKKRAMDKARKMRGSCAMIHVDKNGIVLDSTILIDEEKYSR